MDMMSEMDSSNNLEQIHEIMSCCHDLTYLKEKLVGDPLEISMLDQTKSLFKYDQKLAEEVVITSEEFQATTGKPSN